MSNNTVEKPSLVSYNVYDGKGNWQTGYSLSLKGDPFEMAKMALKYHPNGYISGKYSDGTEKRVYPQE